MQQERVRAVGMNSVDLKGKKKSTMEAVFGNKDSSKPSNLRLVQRINSMTGDGHGVCGVLGAGRPSLLRRSGKERTGEKLKSSGGLVVVEQAIPEGSVTGVWEVRGSVKGKEVGGILERTERTLAK